MEKNLKRFIVAAIIIFSFVFYYGTHYYYINNYVVLLYNNPFIIEKSMLSQDKAGYEDYIMEQNNKLKIITLPMFSYDVGDTIINIDNSDKSYKDFTYEHVK